MESVELRRFNRHIEMEKYRALCGTETSGRLRRSALGQEDILRLPGRHGGGPSNVFVLRSGDLAPLAASLSHGMILDRGVKHRAKPLAHYLAHKTGLVRIRADYRDPGQAERGIRALLASSRGQSNGAVFFIGVGDGIFEQLWNRAGELKNSPRPETMNGELDDFRDLLDQHPHLKVPDELRHKYLGNSYSAERVRKLIVLAAKVDHPVLIQRNRHRQGSRGPPDSRMRRPARGQFPKRKLRRHSHRTAGIGIIWS